MRIRAHFAVLAAAVAFTLIASDAAAESHYCDDGTSDCYQNEIVREPGEAGGPIIEKCRQVKDKPETFCWGVAWTEDFWGNPKRICAQSEDFFSCRCSSTTFKTEGFCGYV
jgi:hypothetical protein